MAAVVGGGGTPVATKLGFIVNPTDVIAGEVITPSVQVAIQDASGNTMTTATDDITIAIGINIGGSILSGTLTKSAVNGVATFDDLSLNKTGDGYTLNATSGTLTAAASGTFNVNHGAADHLLYQIPPQNGTAGVALSSIVVYVVDINNNLIDDDNATIVSLEIATGPGGALITGGDGITVTDGVATFDTVKLNMNGDYTLNAHSALPSGDCVSGTITIVPAGAYQPLFVNQPTNVIAGFNIPDPFVTVGVYDDQGNLATNDSSTVVKLEIATGPAGAKISSGSFINATVNNGIATFDSTNFDKAGDYTLGASFAGNFANATSNSFTVTHNVADKLIFTVSPPAIVENDVVIAPAVLVEIRDQYDNLINDGPDSIAEVTLSINNGGVLDGTILKAAVGGVATFDDLEASPMGVGYVLTASSGSLTPGTSSAFSIPGVISYSSGPGTSHPAKSGGMNVNFIPNGDAGTTVMIIGGNFGATAGTVTFQGETGAETPAALSGGGWTDAVIECTVPSVGSLITDLNIGTGTVKVTRADTSTYSKPFVICPDGMTFVPAGTQARW